VEGNSTKGERHSPNGEGHGTKGVYADSRNDFPSGLMQHR